MGSARVTRLEESNCGYKISKAQNACLLSVGTKFVWVNTIIRVNICLPIFKGSENLNANCFILLAGHRQSRG